MSFEEIPGKHFKAVKMWLDEDKGELWYIRYPDGGYVLSGDPGFHEYEVRNNLEILDNLVEK